MKCFFIYFFKISLLTANLSLLGYVPAQVLAFTQALQNTDQTVNAACCDFRGVTSLKGVDAHGAWLPGATFQPCVVSDANKNNASIVCVPLQAADLTGINLANANLFSVCLDQAILKNANLSGADFTNGSAQKADLTGANVAGIITKGASFCGATMPDGSICGPNLIWSGQGVTINCNCWDKPAVSKKSVKNQ